MQNELIFAKRNSGLVHQQVLSLYPAFHRGVQALGDGLPREANSFMKKRLKFQPDDKQTAELMMWRLTSGEYMYRKRLRQMEDGWWREFYKNQANDHRLIQLHYEHIQNNVQR